MECAWIPNTEFRLTCACLRLSKSVRQLRVTNRTTDDPFEMSREIRFYEGSSFLHFNRLQTEGYSDKVKGTDDTGHNFNTSIVCRFDQGRTGILILTGINFN